MVPESPKYLVTHKRYEEARRAVGYIARRNGRDQGFQGRFEGEIEVVKAVNKSDEIEEDGKIGEEKALVDAGKVSENDEKNEEKKLNGSIKDLIKVRRHLINLILMMFIWVSCSFSVYLVMYNTKKLPGDFFINSIVPYAIDVPMTLCGGLIYHKLGPKVSYFTGFCMSLIGAVSLLLFADNNPTLSPIMISIAKSGVKLGNEFNY